MNKNLYSLNFQVLRQQGITPVSPTMQVEDKLTIGPDLLKFKFLAAKLSAQSSVSSLQEVVGSSFSAADNVDSQLTKYLSLVQSSPQSSPAGISQGIRSSLPEPLVFWKQHSSLLHLIAPLAQDLLCVPATQAFVERVFSITGFLSSGRRSSIKQALEIRSFLRINNKVLKETNFNV